MGIHSVQGGSPGFLGDPSPAIRQSIQQALTDVSGALQSGQPNLSQLATDFTNLSSAYGINYSAVPSGDPSAENIGMISDPNLCMIFNVCLSGLMGTSRPPTPLQFTLSTSPGLTTSFLTLLQTCLENLEKNTPVSVSLTPRDTSPPPAFPALPLLLSSMQADPGMLNRTFNMVAENGTLLLRNVVTQIHEYLILANPAGYDADSALDEASRMILAPEGNVLPEDVDNWCTLVNQFVAQNASSPWLNGGY